MKKLSIGKIIVSLFVAIGAYVFFEYAFLVCTQVLVNEAVKQVCKPQFSAISNIFFGIVIGVLSYLVYGLFQKK